mgnify:CR=1 FL=1
MSATWTRCANGSLSVLVEHCFSLLAWSMMTCVLSACGSGTEPLRIAVRAKLAMADHYDPTTPLSRSKNYMHLKFAATEGIPKDVHFVLIESVADHIIDTLFLQDEKVEEVEVKIVKLAIAEEGEEIGITMRRVRK